MRRLHVIALACLATLAFSALAAPPPSLRFDNLLAEETGSHDVLSLMQDRQGFVWVGTENGLYRHDGYQPTPFHFNPQNTNGLTEDLVFALFEDVHGRIWVGTSHGLARFEAETGGFKLFVPESAKNVDLFIRKIISDGMGGMWLATRADCSISILIAGASAYTVTIPPSPAAWPATILPRWRWMPKGGYGSPPGRRARLSAARCVNFSALSGGFHCSRQPRLNNVRALFFDHRQRLWIVRNLPSSSGNRTPTGRKENASHRLPAWANSGSTRYTEITRKPFGSAPLMQGCCTGMTTNSNSPFIASAGGHAQLPATT